MYGIPHIRMLCRLTTNRYSEGVFVEININKAFDFNSLEMKKCGHNATDGTRHNLAAIIKKHCMNYLRQLISY